MVASNEQVAGVNTPRTVVQDLKELGGMAREMAQEKSEQVWNNASACATDSYEKAQAVERKVEAYIREQPLTSMMIAAGAGILLGMFWARR
ncbi:MAG: YqjD family protein [Phycisphaerae bacterium]